MIKPRKKVVIYANPRNKKIQVSGCSKCGANETLMYSIKCSKVNRMINSGWVRV